jgi:GGDEF domain-containing protein
MTFFYVGSGEFFRFFLLRAQVFRTHLTYTQQNKRSYNRLREEETEEEEDKEEEKQQQRHVFALLLLDFDDFNAFQTFLLFSWWSGKSILLLF